ncbi:MAG: hypothetical protein JWL83_711 [Actinomycetia bacterium]|nr:hypothetical protein [Actinomycetes bacterium]
MIEIEANNVRDIRRVREDVRNALEGNDHDRPHAADVSAVVHELLVAAFELHTAGPVVVRIENFSLLTSVRLQCSSRLDLRDSQFDLRERVLTALTIAFGTRVTADGGTELWAEVPRAARITTS